jgi:hypothetical protein
MEKHAKQLLKKISEFFSTLTDKKISQVAHSSNQYEYHAYIAQNKPHWEDITWRVKDPKENGDTEFHLGFYTEKPEEEFQDILIETEKLSLGIVSHVIKNENGIRLVWNINLNDSKAINELHDQVIKITPDFLKLAFKGVLKSLSNQNVIEKDNSKVVDDEEMNFPQLMPEQQNFLENKFWFDKDEVPQDWFNSPSFILEATKKYEDWLSLASPEIRKNKQLITQIIKEKPQAIKFADESLLEDYELAKLCVESLPITIRYFKGVILEDRQFMLEVIRKDGSCLEFVSKKLKHDYELVHSAVSEFGFALEYAPDEFKMNKKIVIAAITQQPYAIQFADDTLKNDSEIVIHAISMKMDVIKFANISLLRSIKFLQNISHLLTEDNFKDIYFQLPNDVRSQNAVISIFSKFYKNANIWADSNVQSPFLRYLNYYDVQTPWENIDNLDFFSDDYTLSLSKTHFQELGEAYGILVFEITNSDDAWQRFGGTEKFSIIYDVVNNKVLPFRKDSPDEDDMNLIKKWQYLNSLHVGVYEPYLDNHAFEGYFTVSNYFFDISVPDGCFNINFHGSEVDESSTQSDKYTIDKISKYITPSSMFEFISDVLKNF